MSELGKSTDTSQTSEDWYLIFKVGLYAVWGASLLLMLGTMYSTYSIWTGACDDAYCLELNQTFLDMGFSFNLYSLTGPLGILIESLPFLVVALLIFLRSQGRIFLDIFALSIVTFGVAAIDTGIIPNFVYIFPDLSFFPDILESIGRSLIVVWFLFPNGRFVHNWTKSVTVIYLAISTMSIFLPFTIIDLFSYQFPIPEIIRFAIGIAIVTSIVQRYRQNSTRSEQQQIKWVVYSLVAALLIFEIGEIGYSITSEQSLQVDIIFRLIHSPLFYISIGGVGVAIGLAVLRYRLWQIDYVINRSLVYTSLILSSIVLTGLAFWAVFTSLLDPSLIIAIAAVTLAGLWLVWSPLHKRLQRFIDRRLYNIHIDYSKPRRAVFSTADYAAVNLTRYQEMELVGRGGMAEVYRATDKNTGDAVAVKILPPDHAADPEYIQRFNREIQLIAGLDHPNIVRLVDHGEYQGRPFMVMEYFAGGDLSAYLRSNHLIHWEQAQPLIAALAEALRYAHQQGVVHRDIKPSNVLMRQTDSGQPEPVLVDFGIAKIMESLTMMTRSGFIGTLDYISPEQIQASADVDHHADQYSFAVLVFQILAGRLPFRHANPGALLMAHLNQPPPDLLAIRPELPASLAQAVHQAMQKDPADRFASVWHFYTALAASTQE